MKILICSDGTSSAQAAIDLGGLLAGPLKAETTLLGIAERSEDEQPLRDALYTQAQSLRQLGVSPDVVVQFGEPVLQIVQQTSNKYDRRYRRALDGAVERTGDQENLRGHQGHQPPVLMAIGGLQGIEAVRGLHRRKEFIDNSPLLAARRGVGAPRLCCT
jgi:hypothetical protein